MAERLTEQISFRMPDLLAARVRALARRRGIPQAALIREAIENWLDDMDRLEMRAGGASRASTWP
jgi:predicted DNA-binding protein